jgi:uncharacterized phage-associated protein
MSKVYNFSVLGGDNVKGTTVFDVANYFLKAVDRDSGGSITHLKLQKLVYYAQAWHLVFAEKPMFKCRIEAWIHGPVCPELYSKYASKGYDNLPEPEEPLKKFLPKELETLEAVWDFYGDYDGKYLEKLTHQEKPWREARKGLSPGDHCTNEISLATMKEYYTERQENAEKD